MTDQQEQLDEDWWDAVLSDPRARRRPDDEEDGYFYEW